jgi:hypothetical protein
MITVPILKYISGKALIELRLNTVNKLMDGKDGIILVITGVNGGNLLVTDKQQSLSLALERETLVKGVSEDLPAELWK